MGVRRCVGGVVDTRAGVAVLPLMVLAGMAAGAVWALLPAVPRAYLGVNEIITTLLLNYVAIYWVEYGAWALARSGESQFPSVCPVLQRS